MARMSIEDESAFNSPGCFPSQLGIVDSNWVAIKGLFAGTAGGPLDILLNLGNYDVLRRELAATLKWACFGATRG